MNSTWKARIGRATSASLAGARALLAAALACAAISACDVHGVAAPGTVASIVVTPSTSVAASGTQQMVAVGYDAEQRVVVISPTWTIAASGGTINTTGVFSAGTTPGLYANTVVASVGSISGMASITVTVGPIATITVAPTPVTIGVTTRQPFTALAKDIAGNIVTFAPTWSVVAGGGAISSTGVFTAGTVAGTYTNTIQASNNAIKGLATVTETATPLATIVVTPSPGSVQIGATQTFTAAGQDANGNPVAMTPTWSVINGGGTIDPVTGIFTAGTVSGPFASSIQATNGAISGTATVTVTPGALATIAVTPTPVTIGINTTQQFTAVGRDASGNVVVFAPTWSVAASGGAISSTGLFTAGAVAGIYTNTVQASSGTIKGLATVTESATPLATIVVTPNASSIQTGATQTFTAAGQDASGNPVPMTPVWTVVNGGGAINSSTGVFTAGTVTGAFTGTVKATNGAISGTATVTVTPGALATIAVTPTPVTMGINTTKQFSAVGKDASGNVVVFAPTWSVVSSGGAINATGLFTAGAVAGTFANTVQASNGTIKGFASVTESATPLATIVVSPNPVSVQSGSTQTFTAVGLDASGNPVAMTPVWTVVNGGGGIDPNTGIFMAGTVAGPFVNTIMATNGAISATATVTVTPMLVSISVTPSPVTLAAGATQQYAAVGRDGSGNVFPISPVWSVANGGGTINSITGLFTAGGTAGTYSNTVKATSGTVSGTGTVTVTPGALATIAVTPTPVTMGINTTKQFIAVGEDASGNVLVFAPTWSVVSSGGAINATGLFTAGAVAGTFTNTVQASNGTIKGFASVTESVTPLATIVVSPNPVSVQSGSTQTFTAVGLDASGNPVALTPTWTVVDGGGTIGSSTGLFTAGAVAGPYANTVKATSGTISATATVNVTATPPALATITITPNPTTMSASSTQTFTAVGLDASGNPVTISPAWSVANGGGTINSITGLFTAGGTAGTYSNTVKATSGTVSGTGTVTVTVASIVNLGTAAPNGIMAGTSVTCISGGTINADVSISPGNTVTGFGPCVITGVQHLADATAAQGQIDLTTAYNTLAGLPCPPANAIVANLGGTTKAAGVYCTASGIGVTGTLTLDGGGDPNATFVFQAGTSLTTAGSVVLINGAQAKNVYWQVGSSATLGTASAWQGNILTLTSITLVDNATLLGRALARNGAVSLSTNNLITLP